MKRFKLLSAKSEAGFTVIHGLMALAVIFIVGFAGWYVNRSQADKQPNTNSENTSANQESSKEGSKDGFTLPKDWKWYESQDLGFTFAYPKVFGDFKLITEYCCGLTKDDFPTIDAQYKSETPTNPGIKGVKDDFLIDTYKQGALEIPSRKYGPKVRMMSDDGRWVVTEPNSGDPDQYREGMIYKEVTASKSDSGVTVYTFKTGDEGLISYQLVFVAKNRQHMLTLPNFDTSQGLDDGPAQPNDQKPYDELRDQIIKSIALVK